jgi:hypothetical protein
MFQDVDLERQVRFHKGIVALIKEMNLSALKFIHSQSELSSPQSVVLAKHVMEHI